MFFGGWATSRLAVGESKLEAVLYGLILWGVLFMGMIWLLGSGMRTGFGALFGTASGVYATDEGRIDQDRVARDLKRAGVNEATVDKYRGYYERVRDNPPAAADVGRELSGDAAARQAARQASWWTLGGDPGLAGDGHPRVADGVGRGPPAGADPGRAPRTAATIVVGRHVTRRSDSHAGGLGYGPARARAIRPRAMCPLASSGRGGEVPGPDRSVCRRRLCPPTGRGTEPDGSGDGAPSCRNSGADPLPADPVSSKAGMPAADPVLPDGMDRN